MLLNMSAEDNTEPEELSESSETGIMEEIGEGVLPTFLSKCPSLISVLSQEKASDCSHDNHSDCTFSYENTEQKSSKKDLQNSHKVLHSMGFLVNPFCEDIDKEIKSNLASDSECDKWVFGSDGCIVRPQTIQDWSSRSDISLYGTSLPEMPSTPMMLSRLYCQPHNSFSDEDVSTSSTFFYQPPHVENVSPLPSPALSHQGIFRTASLEKSTEAAKPTPNSLDVSVSNAHLSTSRFSVSKVNEDVQSFVGSNPSLSKRSLSIDSEESRHVTFGFTEHIETDKYPNEHLKDKSGNDDSLQSNSSQRGILERFARFMNNDDSENQDSVHSNSSQQGLLSRLAKRFVQTEEYREEDTISSSSSQQGLMAWFSRKMSQTNDDSIQSTSSQAGLLSRAARHMSFKKREKLPDAKRYMKNLYVLSVGFMFTFISLASLRNLQSSINSKEGLGLMSLSALYGSFVLGSFFATTFVQRLKPKWTLCITMCGPIVYTAANFYPVSYTLVPASIIAGFCMSIMWCAQGTYIASIASSYSSITKKPVHNTLNKFYGIFFMIWQLSNIIGNLISSVVLSLQTDEIMDQADDVNKSISHPMNVSSYVMSIKPNMEYFPLSDEQQYFSTSYDSLNKTSLNSTSGNVSIQSNGQLFCGSKYCHAYKLDSSKVLVTKETLYLLYSILLLSSIIGFLTILFFLNKLKKVFQQRPCSSRSQLLALFKMVIHERKMQLLIPLYLYFGIRTCFLFGEITKAYITCAYGVKTIGYMLICFGVSSALGAISCGRIAKHLKRHVLLGFAMVLDTGVTLLMLIWYPKIDEAYILYGAMALYGVSDGILSIQLCSIIGILFSESKEAAFSATKLLTGTAQAIGYGYAPYLCMKIKTYILFGLISLAAICYGCLEADIKRQSDKNIEFETNPSTSKTSLENIETVI